MTDSSVGAGMNEEQIQEIEVRARDILDLIKEVRALRNLAEDQQREQDADRKARAYAERRLAELERDHAECRDKVAVPPEFAAWLKDGLSVVEGLADVFDDEDDDDYD